MHPTIEFDPELIARMSQRGPRYTSYPTADRFTPGFGAADLAAAARPGKPLSLYVHIPFCESLCYYCACNKIITHDRTKAVKYLGYLMREIDMQAALFAEDALVEQLHFGGGTPTYLDDAQMGDLLGHLRSRFAFAPDDTGEFSIEIDPRTVDGARIRTLRRQGFNRLSLGVQDFDEDVQRAVNRLQPEALTRDAISAARDAGFRSISIDLIYGLPLQNVATMSATLDKVIAASPDRISVYNYAHMPQLFKSQKLIRDEDLPDGATKLAMLGLCIGRLCAAGYVYIGMDHFAKPDDELARAQRDGTLHRNFQGYSTHAEVDMVACGVSAISAVNGTYAQNEKSLEPYYSRIDRGELPVTRGLVLSADDLLRRDVIQRLMCDFALDLPALSARWDVDAAAKLASELARLAELERDGLLTLTPDRIEVSAKGRLLIRNVCMVFDDYFGKPPAVPLQRMQYSRTV
ncbi:oxygen-independent coproporphyrinogen III oxidase [Massilia pinisoli]|uniref:Coproporphyrinogen-III oxidase n=1 Tax=Massilia pinisoli TaxID=1772194 RepID=A0ABT1ZVL3_9BURK|nr:oxygen-independent coproporphyrinogen III oxidase [Massilia pinisoli]MCS0583991.1 oxygen-independent coproporphyrinogen III oxidase [Massilia pinisoli]